MNSHAKIPLPARVEKVVCTVPPRQFLKRNVSTLVFTVCFGVLLSAFAPVQAATDTWVGTGASGADWNDSVNWSAAKPGAADTALFNSAISGGGSVANAIADQTAGSISFDTAAGSMTIGTTGGNQLILSNGGTVQIVSTLTGTGNVETINAPLSLTPASTSTAGTYTFSNNNTTATNVLVFGGEISAGTTTSTETLTLNGANTGTNTISGNISDGNAGGGLAINKSGAGTWTLSGANSYSGGTTLTQGSLIFSSLNNLGTGGITFNGGTLSWVSGSTTDISSRTVTIGSGGATLNIVAGTVTLANAIGNGGTGNLTKIGNGILVFSAAAGWTGTNNLNGGTVSVSNVNQLSSNTIAFNGASFTTAGNINFANTITLNSATNFQGTSNLTFSGKFTNSSSNRTLTNNVTGTITLSGSIFLSESAAISRTLIISGNATSNTTISGVIANASTAGAGIGGVTVSPTAGGIVKLTGSNTYTGITTISSGILSTNLLTNEGGGATGTTASGIGQSNNSAANLLIGGGTLQYTGDTASTDRLFSINGTVAGASATIDASGSGAINFTNTGSIAFAGSTNQTRTLILTGTNTGANTLALLVSDNGSGATSLTKNGAGTWMLTGLNTYTGVTTINNGILSTGLLANEGSGATGSTASGIGQSNNAAANLVINGGTLQYTGAGANTDRLFTTGTLGATLDASGSGAVDFTNTGSIAITGTNNRTLTLAGSNTGLNTLAALIGNPTTSGSTSVTKNGAGTWVLTGSNTYKGVTAIDDGILSVSLLADGGGISNIGTTSNAAGNLVIDGGALQYTGATASTNRLFTIGVNGATIDASGDGAVTFSNTGGLAYGGANTASRTLTLTGSNTGTNVFAPVIADAGGAGGVTSVNKSGAGTWQLSGSNTYTGNTTITGGTLALGSTGSIGNSAQIIVGDTAAHGGATFDVSAISGGFILGGGQTLSGHGTIHGLVKASAGSTFTPGGSIGAMTFDSGLDWSVGTVVANFTLGTAGSGTPVTGGAYSQIIVSGGTLTLSGGAGSITINLVDNAGADGNGSLGVGTYDLINYAGANLAGTFNSNLFTINGTNAFTYTISNDTTDHEIILTVTGTGGGGNDSTLSITSNPVSLGNILLTGSTTVSGTAATSLANGSATNSGSFTAAASGTGGASVGVTPGTGTVTASGTQALTVTGTIPVGFQSGSNVVIGTVGATNNSNGAGNASPVNVTANLYETASLTTAVSGTNLNLTNAAPDDQGLRAGVDITSVTLASGTSSNFTAAVVGGTSSVAATTGVNSATSTVATVSLAGKRLNGSYSDTVTGSAQYTDPALRAQGTVGSPTWSVTASVSGHSSTGRGDVYTANILSGQSYGTSNSSGYNLSSNLTGSTHAATTATLLNGTLAAGANTSVNMSFDTGSANGVINPFRASDILTLSGLNEHPVNQVQITDVYVLEMSYDPGATGVEYLGWNNGTQFVNAISGDDQGNVTPFGDGSEVAGAYSGQTTVGTYGYDATNHVVWAVLDHTGLTDDGGTMIAGTNEFAVIPEPGTWGMILGGFGMLAGIQRLRKRKAGV